MRRLHADHRRIGSLGRVLIHELAQQLKSRGQPLEHGERVLLVNAAGEEREATIEHTGGAVTAFLGERAKP